MLEKTLGLVGLVALLVPQAAAQRGGAGGQDGASEAWQLLIKKYDKNKDGKITAKEYPRSEAKFKAFDSDGDGELTAKDFEGRSRGRRGNRGGGRRGGGGMGRRMDPAQMAERILKRAMSSSVDADEDGKVTEQEWKSFLKTNTDADGIFNVAKLSGSMGGGNRGRGGMGGRLTGMLTEALDKDKNGDVSPKELGPWFAKLDANKDGTLAGEEINAGFGGRGNRRGGNRGNRGGGNRRGGGGGNRRGGGGGNRRGGGGQNEPGVPVVGKVAPDFDLPSVSNDKKTVKLSSFAGKKPVALIFGSYT